LRDRRYVWLWIDDKPVIEDAKKPATVRLTAGTHEIRIEYVDKTKPVRLVVNWRVPGQTEPRVLAGGLVRVYAVKLLMHKLTTKHDDARAVAWLAELGHKADRLSPEQVDELIKLSKKHPAWENPLGPVLATTILRNPGSPPALSAKLLAKSAPTLEGLMRRKAVDALVAVYAHACGRDQAKFKQAVGSKEPYDFLCEEVTKAAKSADEKEAEWGRRQGEVLGVKFDEAA